MVAIAKTLGVSRASIYQHLTGDLTGCPSEPHA
jgi:hypothetical protein